MKLLLFFILLLTMSKNLMHNKSVIYKVNFPSIHLTIATVFMFNLEE